MSLKAKLEAVIYAAEEPVTLAQLAGLFADEALEWKAARGAEGAAESAALPQLNEAFPHLGLEPVAEGEAAVAGVGDEAAVDATVESGNGAGRKRNVSLSCVSARREARSSNCWTS